MARMGDQGCTFLNAPGTPVFLTMSMPVPIPQHADAPMLQYDSFTDSELCNGWDFHYVDISTDGGVTWNQLGEDCSNQAIWHEVSMDLSSYAGDAIQIRFQFWAIDAVDNTGLGWLIDDVRITTAPCSVENYCVAAPNSASSTGAVMGSTGTTSLQLNNFALTVRDAPPSQFAVIFYGPYRDQTPIASGYLCVFADSSGFHRLLPGGQFDANGSLDWPVDFTMPSNPAATILAGTNWNFQCWYRDNMAGLNTSNFTDGLSVTFCE